MTRHWLALALVASLATAGCLGSVNAATIPAETLEDQGWETADASTRSVAMGLGEVERRDYASRDNPNRAGVTVATANDVPLLDESRFVDDAMERIEEERGIEFQEAGTRTVTLPNVGATVEALEYNVTGMPVEGKALRFQVPCDPYVVTLAWGTTGDGGGGLFGGSDDGPSHFEQALNVATQVTC